METNLQRKPLPLNLDYAERSICTGGGDYKLVGREPEKFSFFRITEPPKPFKYL
jgi:hypothetical protein